MINDLTRHSVYLQRYGGGLYRRVLPELKKMRDEISAKLLSSNMTELSASRLKAQLAEIRSIIDTTISGTINTKLFEDIAMYESEYSLRVLDKSTPTSVVIGTGVKAAVLLPEIEKSKILLQGMKKPQTIEQIIKTFSNSHFKDIESEIRRGIAQGLTNDDIVKKVQYLSNNRTRSQTEAVVRTVTNHVATKARTETFKQYDNLFKGERYLSTLDSRTTAICMLNSGKIFKFGEGQQVPAHFNCRSLRVAVLKEEYDLDTKSTQSSQFGQVPDTWDYNDFLKRQDAAFQNEVLGAERAKLYRKTGESIDKFVDRSGEFYTIEELKKKDMV